MERNIRNTWNISSFDIFFKLSQLDHLNLKKVSIYLSNDPGSQNSADVNQFANGRLHVISIIDTTIN
jgi:hypothetical protein